MKLLALEAVQNSNYYLSRYEQLVALGVDLFVLNGQGQEGLWPAQRYQVVGSRRLEDLISAAETWHSQEQFEGILTFSESGVLAAAAVAEALGLPGIGVEAARASRNKLIMRQAHEQHGAAHPAFAPVASLQEALEAAQRFAYPVIIKPTLGAASNFVFRADTEAELRDRYARAAAGIQNMSWYRMEAEGIDLGPHTLLVESFLDGDEYLIEALAWDGEVFLGSIVDRITVEADTFDDDVHHAPSALSPEQITAVHEVVRAGAHAQGLVRCAMHAEVRFHRGRPHLLEIAARPGGGGLDHMARISGGYDPIAALRDVSAGLRPQVEHYRPRQVHTVAMCLLCPSGQIAAITVAPELTQSADLFFFKVTAREGDVIRRPPEGNSILGFLGATGQSLPEALRRATDLAEQISIAFQEPSIR